MRSCCLASHDLERALARFLVMREEARFCGRSFHVRPDVLRPLEAWALISGAEEGSSMLPSKH